MAVLLNRNSKIVLFLLVGSVIGILLMSLFQEKFDSNDWQMEPETRYKMVDDIIEQKLLSGKTKEEVILLLGEPSSRSSKGKDVFLYTLGKPPSFFESKREQLVVVFKNEKAIKVSVAIE